MNSSQCITTQVISDMRTVRVFSRESDEAERYSQQLDITYDKEFKRALADGAFYGAAMWLGGLALVAVVWYGFSLVASGELQAGDLTAFLLYTLTVTSALGTEAWLYGHLMKAAGASRRVFALTNRTPQLPFEGGNTQLARNHIPMPPLFPPPRFRTSHRRRLCVAR